MNTQAIGGEKNPKTKQKKKSAIGGQTIPTAISSKAQQVVFSSSSFESQRQRFKEFASDRPSLWAAVARYLASASQWHKSSSAACLCHIDLGCHMIKEMRISPSLSRRTPPTIFRTRITRAV